MNRPLQIINNFLHDLATGLWAGALINLFLLSTKRSIADTKRLMFLVIIFSLVLVAITGILRLRDYRGQKSLAFKTKLLWLKHLLLAFVFLAGSLWGYVIAFGE
ncbi:hypothetical protein G4V39_05300 [Thermosulfuriphilus ammonigenes]|uniref:Uncharacterized protein n=1 Tax=Thermosulfuriphilus ammonigenes TaxID=1936021 RepID=A0A6G7PW28_9BACT|nr:hypothetical protein [Thermosulfuriphilus ammonigenes]MBA2848099.1 putative copper export protein [Thermosulfuriphilus ammonigenes]QIJ71721.1 hypothetical protein G4V39_05300 [Thermosulfuriphilus ammonigenes]